MTGLLAFELLESSSFKRKLDDPIMPLVTSHQLISLLAIILLLALLCFAL